MKTKIIITVIILGLVGTIISLTLRMNAWNRSAHYWYNRSASKEQSNNDMYKAIQSGTPKGITIVAYKDRVTATTTYILIPDGCEFTKKPRQYDDVGDTTVWTIRGNFYSDNQYVINCK